MNRLFTILFVVISIQTFCQVGGISISPTGSPPDPSAALDINFNNKGFLMPRLTQAQRDSISSPAFGLMILNSTTSCFDFYTGSFWQSMVCACSGPPAMPGNVSGLSVYCSGQTGVVYSIAPVPTATSYVWSVPYDATITSGQGTTSIKVTFGSSNSNVSVYALNTCGSGAASSLAVSSLGSVPDNPGTISGINVALNNQSGASFAIAPVAHTAYYNWTVPSGASVATGQGTNSITVNFGTSSGNVCVTDSNGCGNSNTECVNITVSPGCPAHGSATYIYTATQQSFQIPACVSSVTLDVYGAQGGTASTNTGGLGGYANGTLSVTGGDILYIYVGNQPTGNAGGFNGGGNGGGTGMGGGGASDIRTGGTDFSNRVIVAGGGGGATPGWTVTGGSGGGSNGGNGYSNACCTSGNFNGLGGTQGAGGQGETAYNDSGNGSFGQGGNGGHANNDGGGGGGGYYGGGGGDAGGGGGGSGYTGGLSGGSMQNGVQTGSGQIVISW